MPVYEYKCESCSCRFELKQSFNDNTLVTCPQCQSNVRRVFSAVPVIFRGTGFYVTDSRDESKGKFGDKDKAGKEGSLEED